MTKQKRTSAADSLPDVSDAGQYELTIDDHVGPHAGAPIPKPDPVSVAEGESERREDRASGADRKSNGIPIALRDLPKSVGYSRRRIELVLSPQQAAVAKGMLEHLKASGETLANGRKVRRSADAIAWLLEQVGK